MNFIFRLLTTNLLLLTFFTSQIYANNQLNNTNFNVRSYQTITEPYTPDIDLPTLVELPLNPEEYLYKYAAVKELNSNQFQPNQITTINFKNNPTPLITNTNNNLPLYELSDNNPNTFSEFPISDNISRANLSLKFNQSISSDQLVIKLAPNVTKPNTITIINFDDQTNRILTIANEIPFPETGYINFPPSQSLNWQISITSDQLIRISELNFKILNPPTTSQTGLRFLARPNETYLIYLASDRIPEHPNQRFSQFESQTPIITITNLKRQPNPQYQMSDQDNDGIPDTYDNCPNISNPDQIDQNQNSIGDACEDFDFDGILNIFDNCPNHPNPGQQDTDSDGIGDHCDQEESRFTEIYPIIPWMGLGFGFLIVIIILFTTKNKYNQTNTTNNHPTEKSEPPLN